MPDGWEFSIAGLSSIVPDGVDAIRASIKNLEELGYMQRTKTRGKDGKYISEIEIFTERQSMLDYPSRKNRHGETVTDEPSWVDQGGKTVTDNPTEYNTDNTKMNIKKDNIKSIHLSKETDRLTNEESYRGTVSDNIKLDWLLKTAEQHGDAEVRMVHEIYDVICDMVCYPRDNVEIKGTKYPWSVVKSQFLKLRYQHVADVLNRIVDADLGIKNMSAYLISTLYTQSLVGTLELEARIHDDYLKFNRGKPY